MPVYVVEIGNSPARVAAVEAPNFTTAKAMVLAGLHHDRPQIYRAGAEPAPGKVDFERGGKSG